MRLSNAIEALIEGGWTKTHYADWKDARDRHRFNTVSRRDGRDVVSHSSLGFALRAKRTHRYDRDRGAYTVSWADHAKSADVWVSIPDERGNQVAVVMIFDADDKVIRQVSVQGGWKPHLATNEDVAHKALRESPQGRETDRLASIQYEQEQTERQAKRMEDQERLERLADDAREMLEEQGYDPTIIQVTQAGKVILDLEDFLAILRCGLDSGG